jgi:hypothetical protein
MASFIILKRVSSCAVGRVSNVGLVSSHCQERMSQIEEIKKSPDKDAQ